MKTWELAEYAMIGEVKGIQKMIAGNPGYDLLLPDGKTISVKSAISRCLASRNEFLSWHFVLRWRVIPDYFAFVAFDYDQNPLHIWWFPSEILAKLISYKRNFVINGSESDLSKWKEYERPVNGLADRCKYIKRNGYNIMESET